MDHETVDEITSRIGVALNEFRKEIKQDLATELKHELGNLRGEFKQELGDLRGELKQELGVLRGELKQELGGLRGEFRQDLGNLRNEAKQGVEDAKRSFGILAEDLRADSRLLAEGQMLLRKDVDWLTRRVDGLAQVVQLSYSELTARVNDHETRLGSLERRQP